MISEVASASSGLPVWAYVIGVLGVGGMVTAAFTYLGGKRTTSGRIDTTEAARLWEEAEKMRGELRDEVVELRDQNQKLSGKVELLNTQLETVRDKHAECQQNEIRLRERVEALERTLERRTTPTKRRTT